MTVLEVIENHYKNTLGHNGMYVPQICEITGLDWFELRRELTVLYKEKKIKIRPGVNGKLVILNK